MTTVYELVASALTSLSPIPCVAGRYVPASAAAPLPDVFVVYTMVSSSAAQHADGTEKHRNYRMQLAIYSRTGLTSLPDVDTLMTAAGWMRSSEREIGYDRDTGHYGLIKDYVILI